MARGRLLSVNVAQPATLVWGDRQIESSFVKRPVDGTVAVRGTNLEGDRQADPRVHGGPRKAVYAYPGEHYTFWKRELPGVPLPFGSFGENLTTEGLSEETIRPNDRVRIGSAELVVTQPRFPCIKLGFRFQQEDMIRRFQLSGRSGFYLGIVREGAIRRGDAIEHLPATTEEPTIAEIFRRRSSETSDARRSSG